MTHANTSLRGGRGNLATLAAAAVLSLCGTLHAADAPDKPQHDADGPTQTVKLDVTKPPEVKLTDAASEDASGEKDPLAIPLSPLVVRLLDDPLLSDAQRRDMAIFHGQWDRLGDLSQLTPDERARIALARGDLRSDVWQTPADLDPLVLAQALLLRGDAGAALAALKDQTTCHATLLRARALEMQGDFPAAIAQLEPLRDLLQRKQITDPAELTAAAQGVVMLARLEGRPKEDYFLAMDLLGRVRENLAPTYWPASLAEAQILARRDNRPQAIEALQQALSLQPASAALWFEAGQLFVSGFNFDAGQKAIDKLYQLAPDGPLPMLLEGMSLIKQRRYADARRVLEQAAAQYPQNRELLANLAAAEKLELDDAAYAQTVERFDALAANQPLLDFVVGKALSDARQYDASGELLQKAIALQPNWAEAHVEYGLMLMQKGDDGAAQRALKRATQLDPFNVEAANQLKLVTELLTWNRIETPHFVIAYKPGVDEVLARDMPDKLETIYREVTGAFEYEPTRKTRIDLMPTKAWFAVRITGQKDIWTIAAATGDVLSMTPPREGVGQAGAYFWPAVVQHEFTHTVTLGQTHNRIPHWLTEACAVSQEPTARSYDSCQLLAWALREDKLFALDKINWGFIRPQAPYERSLAYQQSEWMLEYITERYGHEKVVAILEAFGRGADQPRVFSEVLGVNEADFLEQFKPWAAGEVKRWGLEPSALPVEILERLAKAPEAISHAELTQWMQQYRNEPALLRLAAERAMRLGDLGAAKQSVLRYATARPVDPWPQRMLVQLASLEGDLTQATPALQELDRQEMDTGVWSLELAKLHRAAGRLDQADAAIRRALWREPYKASYRELAATLAVQRRDLPAARRQIEALTLLEPQVAQHWLRLAAIASMLGDADAADAAARKAKELDPSQNVERFLKPATNSQ